MADLKDFLDNQNYRITVDILQHGVAIYYPDQSLYGIKGYVQTINIIESGIVVATDIDIYVIPLPEWAIIAAIQVIIISKCFKMGFSVGLVKYTCGGKEVKGLPSTSINKEKEKSLIYCIQNDIAKGCYSSSDLAKRHKVYKTYLKLVNILESS